MKIALALALACTLGSASAEMLSCTLKDGTRKIFDIYRSPSGRLINPGSEDSYVRLDTVILPYLKRLTTNLEKKNAQLYLMIVPRHGMTYYEQIPANIRATGTYANIDITKSRTQYRDAVANLNKVTPTVNLLDIYLSKKGTAQFEDYWLKENGHWTPQGARLAADALIKVMGQNIKSLPLSAQFKAVPGDPSTWAANYYPSECADASSRKETIPSIRLEDSSTSLLDDNDSEYRLILWGSSFSRPDLGLPAFLSEGTGLATENFQVDGGGALTAPSDFFSQSRLDPKQKNIIVWELPYYKLVTKPDALNNLLSFRKLLPSTYATKAIKQFDVKKNAKISLQTPLKTDRHYVVKLGFDQPIKDFSLLLDYGTSTEEIPFGRVYEKDLKTYDIELPESAKALKTITVKFDGTNAAKGSLQEEVR